MSYLPSSGASPAARSFSDYLDEPTAVNAATQPLSVQYSSTPTPSQYMPANSSETTAFSFPQPSPLPSSRPSQLDPLSAPQQEQQAALRERLQANAGQMKLNAILQRAARQPPKPAAAAAAPADPSAPLQALVKKLRLHEADPNSFESQHNRLLAKARMTQQRPEDLDPNYETPVERAARLKKLARMRSPEEAELDLEDAMPADPMAERTLNELGIHEQMENDENVPLNDLVEEKAADNDLRSPIRSPVGSMPGAANPSPVQQQTQQAAYAVAPVAHGAPPILAKGEPVLTRREDYMNYRKPHNRNADPLADTFVESKTSGKFLKFNVNDPAFQQNKDNDSGSVLFSSANPAMRNALSKGSVNAKTAALIAAGTLRVNQQTGQLEFTGKNGAALNDEENLDTLATGIQVSQSFLLFAYFICSALLGGLCLFQAYLVFQVRWNDNLFKVVYTPLADGISRCAFTLVNFCFLASLWRFYLESWNANTSHYFYYRFFYPYNNPYTNNRSYVLLRNATLCLSYFISCLATYISYPTDDRLIVAPLALGHADINTWMNCILARFVLCELAFMLMTYKMVYSDYYFLAYEQIKGLLINPAHYNNYAQHEQSYTNNNALKKAGGGAVTVMKLLTPAKAYEVERILLDRFINTGNPPEIAVDGVFAASTAPSGQPAINQPNSPAAIAAANMHMGKMV